MSREKPILTKTSFTPPSILGGVVYLLVCECLLVVLLQLYHSVFHSDVHPDRVDFAVVTVVISLPLLLLWFFTMRHQNKLTLKLEQLAYTDALTGLSNRRGFIRAVTKNDLFRSNGMLLMIDIDHFKLVNDLHGHFVGDVGLVATAKMVTAKVAPNATVARIGGDEFLVFLPQCSAYYATARAKEMSVGTQFNVGPRQVNLTLSIGAFAVKKGDRFLTVLRQVDDEMYRAKSKGRARLVTDPLDEEKSQACDEQGFHPTMARSLPA